MQKRNYLTEPLEPMERCHDGQGVLQHVGLFGGNDFQCGLRFLNYTVLPSGTSIGLHAHGDDEEVYIVLEGRGLMTVNGETEKVSAGDAVVNPPFGTHGLFNDSDKDMRILVFEAGK